jgi:macrolide-specific efflux system membrane fusion protein
MRWKLVAIVVLLAVAGGAIAVSLGAFNGGTAAATSFLTAAATTTDVTDEVTATGTVASTESWDLAFGSAGSTVTWPVVDLAVKVGDRVTKGQVLARSDTNDLEAQIADTRFSALSARVQLQLAQAAYDNASGTDATRQAHVSLYNAQASKAQAERKLAELVAQRALATLTSPSDGLVTAVAVQVGSDAPAGPAITIAAASLQVTTSVVESDVSNISVGQQATVTVSAINAALNGTVATIAPTAASQSGNNGVVSYAVEISLDAPPQALRAGMSADVSIVTATASNVIAIPSRALSGSAGAYTVRVVADDGTVTTRSVTVGLVTSSLAEIKSGLQVGERVVTGTSSTQLANQGGGTRGVFGGGGGTLITGPGR